MWEAKKSDFSSLVCISLAKEDASRSKRLQCFGLLFSFVLSWILQVCSPPKAFPLLPHETGHAAGPGCIWWHGRVWAPPHAQLATQLSSH